MHYKFLVLAMSSDCNEFFTISRKATLETWAKDIIAGKYEDFGFFAYTESKTGKEYIEDNTIYLNCSSDLNKTYEKTIKCFDFLKRNNITFDYIIRTNTSNFINIDYFNYNLLNEIDVDYCGYLIYSLYNNIENTETFDIFGGHFLILSNKFVQKMRENFDIFNESSQIINDFLALNKSINIKRKFITDDLLIGLFFDLYKNELTKKYLSFQTIFNYKTDKTNSSNDKFWPDYLLNRIDDPTIVNFCLVTRVRKPTQTNILTENMRYCEINDMYDLYSAKKQYEKSGCYNLFTSSIYDCLDDFYKKIF